MAVCMNCNKKIGFSTATYTLEENKSICGNCYDKLKSFSTVKKYSSIEAFKETKELINKEMIAVSFNQVSIHSVNRYLEITESKLLNRLEEELEEKEIKEYLEKVETVTKREIKNHLATTGFNYEGYKITNYIGVVSGECVLGTGFLTELNADFADMLGTNSRKFQFKLEKSKDYALNSVITNSIAKGGNAIIGLSFNYLELGKNMVTVIATGTSVTIEKI